MYLCKNPEGYLLREDERVASEGVEEMQDFRWYGLAAKSHLYKNNDQSEIGSYLDAMVKGGHDELYVAPFYPVDVVGLFCIFSAAERAWCKPRRFHSHQGHPSPQDQ